MASITAQAMALFNLLTSPKRGKKHMVDFEITYPASDGACAVAGDVNGVTASVASGVTTIAFPTGVSGTIEYSMVVTSTIHSIVGTTFSASSGAATFTTYHDDGTSGVPAATSPAENNIVHCRLTLNEGS